MADAAPEEKLLNVIKKAQSKLRLKNELKVFTKVNIVLIVLIGVILAVFLVDVFTFSRKDAELNIKLPEEEAEILPLPEPAAEEDYMDQSAKKKPLVVNDDTAKNLILLGIVEGDEKQVVIEDKKKNKTFFLYKGDSLGEFRVYEIKAGSVTLDYKGEKIELKM